MLFGRFYIKKLPCQFYFIFSPESWLILENIFLTCAGTECMQILIIFQYIKANRIELKLIFNKSCEMKIIYWIFQFVKPNILFTQLCFNLHKTKQILKINEKSKYLRFYNILTGLFLSDKGKGGCIFQPSSHQRLSL